MDAKTELLNIRGLVWLYRSRLADAWPTPEPLLLDSLRFALCESTEALDAWIRINRPQYSRNHVKDADLPGELADTAIMLCTAMGEVLYWQDPVQPRDRVHQVTLEDVCSTIGNLLSFVVDHEPLTSEYELAVHRDCATVVVSLLVMQPDLREHVERKLQRIEKRVHPAGVPFDA